MGPGAIEAARVGDIPGVGYQWTGLYRAVTVAVLRDDAIWMFTATYRDDVAEIETAFEELLASTEFSSSDR